MKNTFETESAMRKFAKNLKFATTVPLNPDPEYREVIKKTMQGMVVLSNHQNPGTLFVFYPPKTSVTTRI